MAKNYTIPEIKANLAKSLKERIALYETEMRSLRVAELSKSEAGVCLLCQNTDLPGLCKCLAKAEAVEKCGESLPVTKKVKKGELCSNCGCKDCKCEGVLPGDEKPKDETPDDSGAGDTDPKKVKKGDVPMSAPPTKAGTASAPKSSGGSPKVTAAPKAPTATTVAKKESRIPGRPLAKAAGPRLGGKDPLSQGMTSDAARAASAAAPAAAAAPVPKLSPEQQSARASQFADFTPAGAFSAQADGAAAGALKPPAGVGHLTTPARGPAPAPVSRLQRFTDALHGKKSAPAMKNELAKSLGGCLLCNGAEHDGVCPTH